MRPAALFLAQTPKQPAPEKAQVRSALTNGMVYFAVALVVIIAGCAAIHKTRKYLKDEGMI